MSETAPPKPKDEEILEPILYPIDSMPERIERIREVLCIPDDRHLTGAMLAKAIAEVYGHLKVSIERERAQMYFLDGATRNEIALETRKTKQNIRHQINIASNKI